MIWSNRLFPWRVRCFNRTSLSCTPRSILQCSEDSGLANAKNQVFRRCKSSGVAKRPWTQQEVDTAVARRGAGESCQSVALLLGRTAEAVSAKLYFLRKPGPPRKYARWTDLEAEKALAQYKAGALYSSIGAALGVPSEVAKGRMRRLRKLTETAPRRNTTTWTKKEEESLLVQINDGHSDESAASSLGRTLHAVNHKLCSMRKSDPQIPMNPRRFTAAEDQQMSELHARGVPITDIVSALPRPRSYTSVAARLKVLFTKGTMTRRLWTEHDKAELYRVLVKENLPWPEICALMPERSMASLQAAADRLGFRRKRKPTLPWSAEEIQRLDLRMEQNPSSLPSELEVATLFPGRTSPAVRHRWYQGRHTKRTGYVHKAGASPWTREEDQVVLQGLAKGSSLMTIAALLPNRTQKAVSRRLETLRHRELSRREN